MPPVSTKELKLYAKAESNDLSEGPQMSLVNHLEELRSKVIISSISFLIFSGLGFYFSGALISLLTQIAPADAIFLQIKPGELFFTSMRVSFYVGFAFSLPVIIQQLSSFIFPGLKENEKKLITPFLISIPFLFFAGSVFAYYFVIPSMLSFLFGFGNDIIASSISIESYTSFILMILAICGFAFLMPVAVIILAGFGFISSSVLINNWKYALLLSVCLGAVLTPTPDPFNMSLIAGILVFLYLFSFCLLRVCRK